LGNVTAQDLSIFALFVLGVAVIGIVLWNLGVARLGVVPASMYLNLIPIVALLVSILLGYVPRLEQLAGGTLVLAGVLFVQIRRLLDRPPES
jgi:drug/metabolite transporter (DMT)-like permease